MVMLVPRSPPTNAPITNMYCSDVDNKGFIQYYTPRDSNGRTAKPLFMIIFPASICSLYCGARVFSW